MELLTPVRVVVIDDRPDHLFAIANALALSGVPCVWHLYDNETHGLIPPPPTNGYEDIRLLVTDLNIRNASGASADVPTLAGTLLSEVLLPILPKTRCPYGLMLWTNVEGKADGVGEVIKERIDHDGTDEADRRPAPLTVQVINKNEFVSALSAGGEAPDIRKLITEAAAGVDAVRAQLTKALADPQLQLACAWESRVSKAATATINSVYAAAVMHGEMGKIDRSTALSQIFAKLAFEAAGREDAKEEPSRALDDGLVDLLVDDLRSTDSSSDYAALVDASIGTVLKTRLPSLSSRVRAKLNTDLHVETSASRGVKRVIRGVVLGADNDDDVAKLVGRDKSATVLWSEFLLPENQFKSAAEAAAADERPDAKWLSELAARIGALRPEVEKECRIRLVEIGADCDHAQRKDRTVRLLCALEIPVRFRAFLYQPKSGKLKSEALIELGPWNLNSNEERMLIVSVGRFSVSQTWPLPAGLVALYRLRKPLVETILHRYSNHSSRQGYVAITG